MDTIRLPKDLPPLPRIPRNDPASPKDGVISTNPLPDDNDNSIAIDGRKMSTSSGCSCSQRKTGKYFWRLVRKWFWLRVLMNRTRKRKRDMMLLSLWAILLIVFIGVMVNYLVVVVTFGGFGPYNNHDGCKTFQGWHGAVMVVELLYFCDAAARFRWNLDAFPIERETTTNNLEPKILRMIISLPTTIVLFWIDQVPCTAIWMLWYLHLLHMKRLRHLFAVAKLFVLPDTLPIFFHHLKTKFLVKLSKHREMLNIFWIGIGVFWVFHVTACSVWLVKSANGIGMQSWITAMNIDDASMAMHYVTTLYVTVEIALGYGDQLNPDTILEKVHSILLMCVGVLIFAIIVSNILTAWEQLNAHDVERRTKIELLSRYLDERSVSRNLKKKMLQHHEYLLSNRYLNYEKELLKELPLFLRKELCMELFSDIIRNVGIFKSPHADQNFITAVVLKLKPTSALPNDRIVEEGQIGTDMYIIKRGKVAVWIQDFSKLVCEKTDGDYFGEIACILPQRRTATVVAIDFVQLFSLNRVDLDEILTEFPKMKEVLVARAQAIIGQNTTSDKCDHIHPRLDSGIVSPTQPREKKNRKSIDDGSGGDDSATDREDNHLYKKRLILPSPITSKGIMLLPPPLQQQQQQQQQQMSPSVKPRKKLLTPFRPGVQRIFPG